MKIRFEHKGSAFEYERQPMRSSRFRAVCALIAGAMYVGLVWVVATLCGFWGLLWLFGFTAGIIGIVALAWHCCQRRSDFVVFRRTGNVEKWRVKVYSP